jgi:hypothetical protein
LGERTRLELVDAKNETTDYYLTQAIEGWLCLQPLIHICTELPCHVLAMGIPDMFFYFFFKKKKGQGDEVMQKVKGPCYLQAIT